MLIFEHITMSAFRERTFDLAVLVAILLLGEGSARAQKAAELDHLIRFVAPISSVQEKYIHEVLKSVEPDMGVWVDVPAQQVKVRSHVLLHREELQTAWNPAGLVIAYFGPIVTQHLEDREAVQRMTLPGFEDGRPDPPGYQETKAAWIAAHPKEYEQLSDPLAPH